MNYSPELKDALLRRMLPPNNESITKISREEGISEQTLRNWQDKARKEGYAAPGMDAVPDDWSTQDKFLVVVETASMNETELAEYARKKGLYVEQIKAWKDACMNANGGIAKEAKASDDPKAKILVKAGMVMIAITEGLLLFSDILDYRKSRIEEKLEK